MEKGFPESKKNDSFQRSAGWALVSAAKAGRVEVAQMLLDAGLEINTKTEQAASQAKEAILGAALEGHLPMVKFLESQGVTITPADYEAAYPVNKGERLLIEKLRAKNPQMTEMEAIVEMRGMLKNPALNSLPPAEIEKLLSRLPGTSLEPLASTKGTALSHPARFGPQDQASPEGEAVCLICL